MNKIIFGLLILFTTLSNTKASVTSQTDSSERVSKLLIGTWEISAVNDKENMFKNSPTKPSLSFQSCNIDAEYCNGSSVEVEDKMPILWKVSSDGKKLFIRSNDADFADEIDNELSIVSIDSKTMVLIDSQYEQTIKLKFVKKN